MAKSLVEMLFAATIGVLAAARAAAFEAGWHEIEVAGSGAAQPSIPVALYYPTQAAAKPTAMGPFSPRVAMDAPPEPSVKGLIVISHGAGGSEIAHSRIAEALAQHGYLVAALRHPGDNWREHSLLLESPERYFSERPRQVSRVIDALLSDPDWKRRIARDARGPRVGAVGHSAGGYTVIALAGGRADLSRSARHCRDEREEDPIYCAMGRRVGGAPPPGAPAPTGPTRDPRVRAVVALAPVGVVFTADSLARISIPVDVYEAENDRFLVPRYHAEWVARNLPGVELHRVHDAWHFAFIDKPNSSIPSEDGDIAADPAGFDRAAFLESLSYEVAAFFDRTLTVGSAGIPGPSKGRRAPARDSSSAPAR